MKEWMEANKGKLFKEKDTELIKKILSNGSSFNCNNIECHKYPWKGKPREVYLTCPKCDKSLVSFHLRKFEKGIEICGTTDWDQEDM